jgi:hypothetical protein
MFLVSFRCFYGDNFCIFIDIDDCSPNQCQNGATCVDGVTSYTCSCVAGYNGTLCEIGKHIYR